MKITRKKILIKKNINFNQNFNRIKILLKLIYEYNFNNYYIIIIKNNLYLNYFTKNIGSKNKILSDSLFFKGLLSNTKIFNNIKNESYNYKNLKLFLKFFRENPNFILYINKIINFDLVNEISQLDTPLYINSDNFHKYFGVEKIQIKTYLIKLLCVLILSTLIKKKKVKKRKIKNKKKHYGFKKTRKIKAFME